MHQLCGRTAEGPCPRYKASSPLPSQDLEPTRQSLGHCRGIRGQLNRNEQEGGERRKLSTEGA